MKTKYIRQLLREAAAHPDRILKRPKFWKPALLEEFLRHCDDCLFASPSRGAHLAQFAPEYATRVIEHCSEVSAPIVRLRAFATLGNALRATGEFAEAEKALMRAMEEEPSVPALVMADLYKRLAYLRLVQHRPDAFSWIEKALTLHRLKSDLVDRHELGCCLLCRGHIHFELGDPGESLRDIGGALNHISLRRDSKPYYAALHNLVIWAIDFGTDAQLEDALEKLKPALVLLASFKKRHYAKYKLRWLIALLQARLGQNGQATLTFLEVRSGFLKMKLPYELGMLSIDLGIMYLQTGREVEARQLAEDTLRTFRSMDSEPNTLAALLLWQNAQGQEMSVQLLRDTRAALAQRAPARR